jgi:hypothetical protein
MRMKRTLFSPRISLAMASWTSETLKKPEDRTLRVSSRWSLPGELRS